MHSIPALMEYRLIKQTPEKHVLWHGNDNAASRFYHEAEFLQYRFVILYVLEHIKHAHYVELFAKRDLSCVHLQQVHGTVQPLGCETQPFDMNVARAKTRVGHGSTQGAHHEPSTGAYLHEIPRRLEESGQTPENDTISAFKPEAGVFEGHQKLEVAWIEIRVIVGELRRKAWESAKTRRREAADRTGPIVRGKRMIAAKATAHLSPTWVNPHCSDRVEP